MNITPFRHYHPHDLLKLIARTVQVERSVVYSDVRWKIFQKIFRIIFPENFPFLKIIT
jgi:hypothetical protein